MLFVIFIRLVVIVFSVLCVKISVLVVVIILNLFGVVMNGSFVSWLILLVMCIVNFGCVFSFVLIVVLLSVSLYRCGSVDLM